MECEIEGAYFHMWPKIETRSFWSKRPRFYESTSAFVGSRHDTSQRAGSRRCIRAVTERYKRVRAVDFDARHRKQVRGGGSVFTYMTDSESRSFRSIAQNILARTSRRRFFVRRRMECGIEGAYLYMWPKIETRSFWRKRPMFYKSTRAFVGSRQHLQIQAGLNLWMRAVTENIQERKGGTFR